MNASDNLLDMFKWNTIGLSTAQKESLVKLRENANLVSSLYKISKLDEVACMVCREENYSVIDLLIKRWQVRSIDRFLERYPSESTL